MLDSVPYDGMLNANKEAFGVRAIPTYNFQGYQKAKFCKNHKKINMIDVNHKRCVEEGCNKIPTFNFPGEQ